MKVEERNMPAKLEETRKNDDRYRQLDKVIAQYEDTEGTLITVLHRAQKIFGYLPREIQIYIANRLGIPLPEVYGVVSFYSLFSTKPRGKYTIEVCLGTACYVKGAEKILEKLKEELKIEPGEISEDGRFTIETTRCLGACSLAPIISIGDDVHGKVSPDQVNEILNKYQ